LKKIKMGLLQLLVRRMYRMYGTQDSQTLSARLLEALGIELAVVQGRPHMRRPALIMANAPGYFEIPVMLHFFDLRDTCMVVAEAYCDTYRQLFPAGQFVPISRKYAGLAVYEVAAALRNGKRFAFMFPTGGDKNEIGLHKASQGGDRVPMKKFGAGAKRILCDTGKNLPDTDVWSFYIHPVDMCDIAERKWKFCFRIIMSLIRKRTKPYRKRYFIRVFHKKSVLKEWNISENGVQFTKKFLSQFTPLA
jgi:hypothetical protein